MIKFENTEVVGWEAAIRGMRNPMNSWEKSDSYFNGDPAYCKICPHYNDNCTNPCFDACLGPCFDACLGLNDLALMKSLRKVGTDHSKFMRMITVTADITAPLYWWKEYDTYKVGTVANSCSTMHKIHAKEFTLDDFSHEHLSDISTQCLLDTILCLNQNREAFVNWKDDYMMKEKDYWWQMIQLLPSSYNQKRTVMLNYEVLTNMYHARKNHKLDEWHDLCHWVESLPYSELITFNWKDTKIDKEKTDG